MKITVAQLNYHIGHFEHNYTKMEQAIARAKESGSDIICFSELATCGYPPRDFLDFDDFIQHSMDIVDRLTAISQDIGIVVGAPSKNPLPEGKDLFNSAYFLYNGEILHVQHKALLPTYDIFDEYRYFEPATKFETINFRGKKIALSICEDIWNIGNENPLYTICPLDEMIGEQPDFVINVSASPFSYTHAKRRIDILRANTTRYGIPIFYVNHIGGQTEIIFDGGSVVMSPDGSVYDELPYFEENLRTYDLNDVLAGGRHKEQPKEKIALIHDAIILGIRDYFSKLGFSSAILGLSGGIDSAVTAALTAQALGPKNVHVVMMPSEYSSDHSIKDSEALASNYGMVTYNIPIQKVYTSFLEILSPHFQELPFNIAEENIQARSRAVILMALSNKFGHILLNTSNKSEAAVGYGTLYGDMCGGLSVLGDVYKTDVYALARYINRDEELIPLHIITKPPSAELRPDQKDSDSLPPYDILDEILFLYIEQQTDPQDIIAQGYSRQLVQRILKMVNTNEFKRYQTPPVLRVSDKAFGMGRRMPIVGKYLS